MFHAKAKPTVVLIKYYNAGTGKWESPHAVTGWESCYVLGVVKSDQYSYISVALMGGVLLAGGFKTLEEAHSFNRCLIDHPKFFAGTASVEEMYKRSGGEGNFFGILNECVKKIQKRKTSS